MNPNFLYYGDISPGEDRASELVPYSSLPWECCNRGFETTNQKPDVVRWVDGQCDILNNGYYPALLCYVPHSRFNRNQYSIDINQHSISPSANVTRWVEEQCKLLKMGYYRSLICYIPYSGRGHGQNLEASQQRSVSVGSHNLSKATSTSGLCQPTSQGKDLSENDNWIETASLDDSIRWREVEWQRSSPQRRVMSTNSMIYLHTKSMLKLPDSSNNLNYLQLHVDTQYHEQCRDPDTWLKATGDDRRSTVLSANQYQSTLGTMSGTNFRTILAPITVLPLIPPSIQFQSFLSMTGNTGLTNRTKGHAPVLPLSPLVQSRSILSTDSYEDCLGLKI
jgi:hypothetical protein